MLPLQQCLSLLHKRWGTVFNKQVSNIVAYGSGVLPQTAEVKDMSSKTIDLLVEVQDPAEFHSGLMKQSRKDYGGLSWLLGSKIINFSARNIFPMHSNHILLGGRNIKYSVIGKEQLREDLITWKYLSFAGRLHKAVIPLQPLSQDFQRDLQSNRVAALSLALLLRGRSEDQPIEQLLSTIVSLSYSGDIRFSVGAQNPHKVQNIVKHSLPQLKPLYLPVLQSISKSFPHLKIDNGRLSFELTPPLLSALVGYLPACILEHLFKTYGGANLPQSLLLVGSADLRETLQQWMVETNRRSSRRMAVANLVTGSPLTNLRYLIAKLVKGKK